MYPDTREQGSERVPSEERKVWFIKTVEDKKHSLFRVAQLMLRRTADAEDAVSDAVEATWRHLDSVRSDDALPAYLMRSTINACHANLRKRKRETATDDPEPFLPPVHPETPVWMYLSGLKEKYRLPLMLRFSENMADEEIAAVLHLPRGTVSSHISRGLKILREQIEKEEMGRG